MTSLARHLADHGGDFGITDEETYARFAAEFRIEAIRNHYLCKLDAGDHTIRFFDPTTGTFGAYWLDGTSRTVFIPAKPMAYWNKQPGVLIDV